MFTYKTSVKMHDTDAAGRIFFAKQFFMFHDAYEAFIEKKGLGFARILKTTGFFLPIVHAAADYKEPLFVGDQLTVTLKVAKIGKSSIVLHYELRRAKTLVGTGQTVHVAVSNTTGKKIELPTQLKRIFKTG